MCVAMRHVDGFERFAAINGAMQLHAHDPYRVLVGWIGHQTIVVPGPLSDPILVVHPHPRLAGVVAAIEPAQRFRLNNGPDPIGVHRTHRKADLTRESRGEPTSQLGPAVTGVGGLPNAPLRAAGNHRPRLALTAPEGGVEDARIARVHHEI